MERVILDFGVCCESRCVCVSWPDCSLLAMFGLCVYCCGMPGQFWKLEFTGMFLVMSGWLY